MNSDWWRGATVYQIYPRSFADGNGDGVGDLAGITARLPYVAALGVDAVWLSPFFTSPMRDFGYDVADHRGVDPLFGTAGDFDALLVEAHRLGLKVIIDQVWSHTAAEHPWFAESRASRDNARADWYVWADARPDGSPPIQLCQLLGGAPSALASAQTYQSDRGLLRLARLSRNQGCASEVCDHTWSMITLRPSACAFVTTASKSASVPKAASTPR
jgi:glycosidase